MQCDNDTVHSKEETLIFSQKKYLTGDSKRSSKGLFEIDDFLVSTFAANSNLLRNMVERRDQDVRGSKPVQVIFLRGSARRKSVVHQAPTVCEIDLRIGKSPLRHPQMGHKND